MTAQLSDDAIQDLAEIGDYLAAFNADLADRTIDAIRAAADRHARSPLTGRARDELEPGLRSFVVQRKYVVFFRPSGDTIEIVRVIHGSRNIEAVFREEPPGTGADT